MIVNTSLRLGSLNARSCVVSHVLYFTYDDSTTLCWCCRLLRTDCSNKCV